MRYTLLFFLLPLLKMSAQYAYDGTAREELNFKTKKRVLETTLKSIKDFEAIHAKYGLSLKIILNKKLQTTIVLGQKENILYSFDGQQFSLQPNVSALLLTDEVIKLVGEMYFGRSEVDRLKKKPLLN